MIDKTMIAPCGIDCGVCMVHLRKKKNCLGCNSPDEKKPKHCIVCRIKTCELSVSNLPKFCFSCGKFPCTRLKQLDKRYQANYGMSLIDNLKQICEVGIEEFVRLENQKWVCQQCGDTLCVHQGACPHCGEKNPYFPGKSN